MSTMTAYQLVEWGAPPEFRDVEVPTPAADEVLIKVAGVGLCHSDFLFLDTPPGIIPWELPFTLGHESAGWVEQPGADVDDLEVGQPVSTRAAVASTACAGTTTTARAVRAAAGTARTGASPSSWWSPGASWCRSRRWTPAGSARSPTPGPRRTTR
jgi:Zn-dependent alcohol dehydrogenase